MDSSGSLRLLMILQLLPLQLDSLTTLLNCGNSLPTGYVGFPSGRGGQPVSSRAEMGALLHDQGRMPDLLDAIDIMHQQEADQVILLDPQL